MVHTLGFFSSKSSLFHNSKVFGSCIIHILYTGCAKIKKNNSGAKRLRTVTLANTNNAVPDDGVTTPKHVGGVLMLI